MAKVVISGSSGLVGSHLKKHFGERGWQVQPISWRKAGDYEQCADAITGADVVVNLAGQSVFRRWTKSYKKIIWSSRVDSTRELVGILSKLPANKRPKVFFHASGCGIYTHTSADSITEESPLGDMFLAQVAAGAEAEAEKLQKVPIRTIQMRLPAIVSNDSPSWRLVWRIAKLGLYTTLGDGSNLVTWVGIDDVVKMLLFLIDNEDVSGAVNFVSPELITQKEFVNAMRKALNRPIPIPRIPVFLAKLAAGDMVVDLLLGDRKIVPAKLQKANYEWVHPTFAEVLQALIQSERKK